MEWNFKEQAKDDKTRDPMQDAFFTIENIDHHTQALVRESIQNTLDEKIDGEDNVRIKIFISSENNHLSPQTADKYFKQAFPHFKSPGSGLHKVPDDKDVCKYLVFEDFNTHGLTGNPVQYYDTQDRNNRFYYFFRAEGKSGKSGSDRGRWGIGKYVFPRSSKIKSFFALTVRHDDDRQLLVGQSVLKSHQVDATHYTPDGWFGEHTDEYPNQPIENSDFINEFKQIFNLQRENEESGLSIVVPYLEDDINLHNILHNILQEYYYPIHFGDLEIDISNGIEKIIVTSENLVDSIGKYYQGNEEKDKDKILQTLEMCKVGEANISGKNFIEIKKPNNNGNKAIKITKNCFSDQNLEDLKNSFNNEEIISIRIPIDIHYKKEESIESYFDIHFQKNPSLTDGIPIFIREGILIPDQIKNISRARDILTVINIQDKGLAQLLGDSENPAHTEWQHQAEKLYKYKNPQHYINLVKRCIYDITLLMSDDGENDVTTLRDIFPSPTNEADSLKVSNSISKNTKKKKKKKKEPSNEDSESRKKPIYKLNQTDDGIVIENTEEQVLGEHRFTVKFAYMIPGGNPFNKWSPLDFKLDGKDIKVNYEGENIFYKNSSERENKISFTITGNAFKVSVTGFDINRDLAVDVSRKEISDAQV